MKQFLRRSIQVFLAFHIVLGTGYSQSGNSSPQAPVRISEEVLVTANRYEEKAVSVAANVSVINRSEIANSTAQDIPSLLRTQAGIQVIDIAGNRRNYRVDLRGFGETAKSNTLVLVDGRRVNQADLSGTDWIQIPLSRVERIEIVRGGRGSVLYGDNASGGVINIITRSGDSLTGGGAIRGGSYQTFRADGYLGGSQGDFAYAVSGNYFRSDGYRENSAFNGGDLGGSINVPLSDSFDLGISTGYHSDKAGLPGGLKDSDFDNGASRTDSVHPDDFADVDDYYVLIRPKFSFRGTSLAQLDFSFRKRDSLFFSSYSGGTYEGNTDINTYTVSPQLLLKEPLGGLSNTFTAGLDFVKAHEDIVNQSNYFGDISTGRFKLEKRNSSFFLHDELYPMENLALSAGYRYDRVDYSFSPSTSEGTHFDQNLYTAGINYRLYRESRLYFSASRSFRYPLLDELFNFFSNTIDPSLRPQTSDDLELGLRHYFTDSFYANMNYFLVNAEDEIFYNPAGGPFGFGGNENFDGPTRRTGIEMEAGSNIGNITLRGSYTFTTAQVRQGQYEGSWVPSVPKNRFSVNASMYLTTNFTVGLEGSYIGKRPFESDWVNSYGNHEDYFLLNSRITYTWQRYRAFLDVNNLLNQEYSEYGILGGFPVERAFYPSPKANLLLGLSVDF